MKIFNFIDECIKVPNNIGAFIITNYPKHGKIVQLEEIAIKNNLKYLEIYTNEIAPYDLSTLLYGGMPFVDNNGLIKMAESFLPKENKILVNFRIAITENLNMIFPFVRKMYNNNRNYVIFITIEEKNMYVELNNNITIDSLIIDYKNFKIG